MNRLICFLALSLPVLSACPAGFTGGGPSDDGGVQILDSGNGNPVGDGGNEPGDDAGTPPGDDAGTPPGGDAGTPPGGDGGFTFPDGGFSFDGGLAAYEGQPEPGVRCGETLDACAEGAACCLSVNFMTFAFEGQCSATNDNQCEANNFVATCDGREDCGNGDVCCLVGLDNFQPDASCMTAAACDDMNTGGSRVCTNSSECTGGQVCCGLDGLTLPVDMGVCRDSCQQN